MGVLKSFTSLKELVLHFSIIVIDSIRADDDQIFVNQLSNHDDITAFKICPYEYTLWEYFFSEMCYHDKKQLPL